MKCYIHVLYIYIYTHPSCMYIYTVYIYMLISPQYPHLSSRSAESRCAFKTLVVAMAQQEPQKPWFATSWRIGRPLPGTSGHKVTIEKWGHLGKFPINMGKYGNFWRNSWDNLGKIWQIPELNGGFYSWENRGTKWGFSIARLIGKHNLSWSFICNPHDIYLSRSVSLYGTRRCISKCSRRQDLWKDWKSVP